MGGVISHGVNEFHAILDADSLAILRGNYVTLLMNHELGLGEVSNILIEVPEDTVMLGYDLELPFEAEIAFYLNTTYTGGTLLSPYNANWNYDGNVHGLVLYHDVTVSAIGDLINATTYGSAARAGASQSAPCFVLPSGSTVLFQVTSNAASNNIVTRLNFKFCEIEV